jgi:serine/threonine protein kinase
MEKRMSFDVPELKLSQSELENYQIVSEVGTGGWGKVYLALRRSDLKIIALKFFGYTNRAPELSAINHEVGLMMSLIGVPGWLPFSASFLTLSLCAACCRCCTNRVFVL